MACFVTLKVGRDGVKKEGEGAVVALKFTGNAKILICVYCFKNA
jgi:hypothetical protein